MDCVGELEGDDVVEGDGVFGPEEMGERCGEALSSLLEMECVLPWGRWFCWLGRGKFDNSRTMPICIRIAIRFSFLTNVYPSGVYLGSCWKVLGGVGAMCGVSVGDWLCDVTKLDGGIGEFCLGGEVVVWEWLVLLSLGVGVSRSLPERGDALRVSAVGFPEVIRLSDGAITGCSGGRISGWSGGVSGVVGIRDVDSLSRVSMAEEGWLSAGASTWAAALEMLGGVLAALSFWLRSFVGIADFGVLSERLALVELIVVRVCLGLRVGIGLEVAFSFVDMFFLFLEGESSVDWIKPFL